MARTERVPEVDDRTASALRALWRRAADVDGVEAVSEAFRLAVGPPRDGVVHLLRCAGDGTLVGYAQVAGAGTPDAVAELVVDPPHRRRGHGRALLDAVLDEGARSVWAHGLLPAADALARSAGLAMTRSLYRMTRPLTADDAVDPVLPGASRCGRSSRAGTTRPGCASTPRRSRATPSRAGSPSPTSTSGWPSRGSTRPASSSSSRTRPTRGRRLPLDQGRGGTGRARARAGPRWAGSWGGLRRRRRPGAPGPRARRSAHRARPRPPGPAGAAEVELYVDGDNTAARRTYARLGFTDAAVDGQYARATT